MTPEDVLHAMRRLEAIGETSVHPSRVADFMPPPRPSEAAMWQAIEDLLEAKKIDWATTGNDRYTLARPPYATDEQLSMTNQGGTHGR